MLKKTLIALTLPLVSVLAISVATPLWGVSAQPASQTAAQRRGYSPAVWHASKDDRGKRKRHHGSRSQRIEWRQFPGSKAHGTAIRGRRQFFLSHSGV